MPPVLGIDFGTSNSAAAWVDDNGKVRVCAIREGSSLLPSVAWYGPRGHALVGQPARQQIVDDPTNTVFGFKRFLGRRFSSPFVHQHKDAFAYRLVEDDKGLCAVEIRGELKPLEDVAVDVLQRLLELAAISVGSKIEEVVITAPAHYGFAQRAVLRRAARRAGVRVKSMVNEPTAASVYYARAHPGVDRTILVFDLGGGTFDATLLTIVSGVVKVLATGGDAFLGGADFDAAVVAHLVERFRARTGVDLSENTVAMQRLLIAAEAAKIELSRSEEVRIRVPCVAGTDESFLDLEDNLTRDELEKLTERLAGRAMQTCRDLLAQSNLEPASIDELVFVGGMTRMPMIRARLTELFPLNGQSKLNPDLGVVVGAALLAHGDQSLIDVASMSVGVTLPGAPGVELVPANTPVPAVRRLPLSRPPSDRTLVMGFYEAVEATSLERDALGSVRVDPAWLTKNAGALTLEAWLGTDSELTLFLDAQGGQKLPLELKVATTTKASSSSSSSSKPASSSTAVPAAPSALPVPTASFRSLAFSGDAAAEGGAPILEKMEAHARSPSSTRQSSISGLRPTDDDANAPKAGDTLGGYLLLDVIGQGGMGTVYLAEHIRLGRRVALKMLRQRFAANPAAIDRFLYEARAVNKIRHENIIEVTDLFETDDGRTCYIMELLDGRSVADVLRRVGPPRVDRAIRIASQVANAMVAVHDAHIIHRDLKPENIYLTQRAGRDDVVKLLDFGVAKLTDGSGMSTNESQAGLVIGTLEYMSPEQLIGQAVDPRADIWSLGVCLYETLTGKVPYSGDSERSILFAQLNGPPSRPSEAAPAGHAVPRELDDLVLQCLEREPTRRPQTMREVRGRLDAIAEELVGGPSRAVAALESDAADAFVDGFAARSGNALTGVRPALSVPAHAPTSIAPTMPASTPTTLTATNASTSSNDRPRPSSPGIAAAAVAPPAAAPATSPRSSPRSSPPWLPALTVKTPPHPGRSPAAESTDPFRRIPTTVPSAAAGVDVSSSPSSPSLVATKAAAPRSTGLVVAVASLTVVAIVLLVLLVRAGG
jgi:molecular chaperone DnaK